MRTDLNAAQAELVDAALAEVPEGSRVLEVDAGAGLVTRRLLEHASCVTALEAAQGIPQGRTLIAALVTETAAAMFRTGDYAGTYPGRERLVAMSWGAEDLSSALGAREQLEKFGTQEIFLWGTHVQARVRIGSRR